MDIAKVVIEGKDCWMPRPEYFVPVRCCAAYFGGAWDEAIVVTAEQAAELARREGPA